MQQRIAQFPALMDGTWSIRRGMAGDSTRPRKLGEEFLEARGVLCHRGIKLRVGAFEIRVGHNSRSAVPGPGNKNGVQIVLLNEPVHVDVNEIESRCGSPMSQQARLGVLEFERLAQQRIVMQIYLADGKIVGGAPVAINLP